MDLPVPVVSMSLKCLVSSERGERGGRRESRPLFPYPCHPLLPSIWTGTSSQAIGPDAAKRDVREFEAAVHWQARPTLVLLVAERDDLTYEHVPLAPRRPIKTRCRYDGPLPAREFPVDD